ncbi:MAG: hypothetical protein WAW54_05025 [Parvibaculum sedimenti]
MVTWISLIISLAASIYCVGYTAALNGLSLETKSDATSPEITKHPHSAISLNQAEGMMRHGLEEQINLLLDNGKEVFLVYPIPESSYDIPSALARLAKSGGGRRVTTQRSRIPDPES